MIEKTFEELKISGNLPSPSGIGMRILQLTQGEDFSTEEIGQAIMADSALTGRLLKLANSAQAGALRPISTVSEATMRLGIRTVRNVALGLSLISANREGRCEGFGYDRYWAHSLARAVAAQTLAARTRLAVPAEAYICGLLCEVGYLALASVYPEEYAEVLSVAGRESSKATCVQETQRFGIDHRDVAMLMLEDWGLPEDFGRAARAYEDRSFVSTTSGQRLADLADLLAAATILADVIIGDSDGGEPRWDILIRRYRELERRTGIESREFATLCNTIAAEWREWGETLDIPTHSVLPFDRIDERLADPVPEVAGAEIGAGASVVTPSESMHLVAIGDEAPIEEKGLRILAVEDDEVSLKMLTRILTKDGHTVTPAHNGNEALKLALETSPQIVIADWVMPEFDGIQLCKALRRIEQGRNMYFLIVTSRDDERRVVEAFDAGVDDFITKPYNPKLLMARLKGGQRIIRLQEEVANHQKKVRAQAAELGKINRKLRAVALTDVLTQLPNRRYAMKRLDQQWAFCERGKRPLSVILIDIDHFKSVNDQHGHDIGDVVLQEAARSMKTQAREEEEPCRLGGEEFLIICGNTTAEQAALGAERIRVACEQNIIRAGTFERAITLSLGVAELTADMKSPDDLLKAADKAVYAAKHAGRNRTHVAGHGEWRQAASA